MYCVQYRIEEGGVCIPVSQFKFECTNDIVGLSYHLYVFLCFCVLLVRVYRQCTCLASML